MKQVFIEMEKLKNLHSGLGQFNLHLGHALVKQNKEFELNFYLPKNREGIFGKQTYTICKSVHKYISPIPRQTSLWHGTHQQSKYLPSGKHIRKILTVHDLNFLYKYQGWKRKRALRNLQRLADKMDKIVAISEFTAGDLQRHIRLGSKSPVVIYNGNSLSVYENASVPAWMPAGPFLFAVGIIAPRKNFHVLVDMLVHLKDIKLVIAGNQHGSYAGKIREEIKRYKLEDRVVMPGEIPDEERYWLYKNCEGFVFPSLAEGFGLPVIEAMSVGKPVFISNLSSLPEIGGNLAYYWNNFDPVQMAEVVEKGLNECRGNTEKQEAFKKHASFFSWERSADEYLKLYHEIISG